MGANKHKVFGRKMNYGNINLRGNMKNLLLLGMVLLTGCMSFNNAEVPVVKNEIPVTKPVIEMKTGKFTQKFNGEGASRGVTSNKTVAYAMIEGILDEWYDNDLIRDYEVIGKLKDKPDYTLTINGFRNEESSIFGSIMTGLTFYIIPSAITMTWELEFVLKDNMSLKEYKTNVTDSFTIWQSIIFLPVFPLFPVGLWNMQEDMGNYIFSKFKDQGAFSRFYKKELGANK